MKIFSSIPGVTARKEEHDGRFLLAQFAQCSCCDAELRIAPGSGGSILPEEPVFKKMRQNGWVPEKKGKHICDKCQEAAQVSEKTREMTVKERRQIFREIDESYEEANSRYCDAITDQSIAQKLGVPRKWVQDIREENFGPAGINVEVERLTSNLAKTQADLTGAINAALSAAADCEKAVGKVDALRADLDKLKAAFGPYRAA